MDQKSWIWKKRSTEKTLVADKGNYSFTKNEEVTEIQKLQSEKAELERELQTLEGKLSSALSECHAKDSIAKKQVKIAEEAIAGWEKAEAQTRSLKQELEKVLQQKASSEERIHHLDAALKECMQQLRFVREEQEKRVHGAVIKTSEAFEKVRIALDDKLAESGKRLAKLSAENTQLIKALSGKDKVIEDLSNYRTRLEVDFKALMSRVEATEKENASLKYEVCVLEKELDIRNEEREFNRRTAEVAQKQHLENVRKIGKLELECQRLRLLVRNRLPGPATLAKMKSEVEVLGKHQVETKRIKSNPYSTSSMESCVKVVHDPPTKSIKIPAPKTCKLEDKNRTLKVGLNKISSEPQSTYLYSYPGLSQTEGKAEEFLKGQNIEEPVRHLQHLQDHSVVASSEMCSEDKAICAESWASGLISELEHFKNEKQLGNSSYTSMGNSEINLMDDFAEMEKAAVVSVSYPSRSSHHSSEIVNDGLSEPSILDQEIPPEHVVANRIAPGCLSDMVKILLDHSQVSRRNPHEVLDDMKLALAHNIEDKFAFCGNGNSHQVDPSCTGNGLAAITMSPSKSVNLDALETKKSGQKLPSIVNTSINKIIELLEGLNIESRDNGAEESFSGKEDSPLSYKNSENSAGYVVRVFQWKIAELSPILQQLISTCNKLLNGTADLEQFTQQVASNLEWVINHCFSIQDVSSMKDAMRSYFDWDESTSDAEVECGSALPCLSSYNRIYSCNEALHLAKGKSWNDDQENNESYLVDLEGRLQSEIAKGEGFETQLQEYKETVENLRTEMETMKQTKGESGNLSEKQKMMKEDLEAQLMDINNEWRKACQTILCLEDKLENKNNLCMTLEQTCRELQTKIESMTNIEAPDHREQWETQLENDWEITTASEKLAKCQETILNLGKQLKALASPSDAALFDKVLSKPDDSVGTSPSSSQRNTSQRSSLLDKMLAEDSKKITTSPISNADIKKTNICTSSAVANAAVKICDKFATTNGINRKGERGKAAASMDIVPRRKRRGWSIFRRLFWRRKKGNTDKTPLY
ncbi:filament-like plant protein 7 [Andrographis paniculata]|uniref:filament-like plant protein 7 n=1 Tax=Andrographis paniculata TaxID=175694 RepID=UPI0021E98F30|nr:filament-like plant protein 7 [Andrographis paniculata]XP_051115439.1 filament-like plant protein 7 [Andrographis paniculata]